MKRQCLRQWHHQLLPGHAGVAPQPPGAEVLTSVLVVVTDITDVVARERTEAAQREFVALVTRLLRDRSGFESFFEETEALMLLRTQPNL